MMKRLRKRPQKGGDATTLAFIYPDYTIEVNTTFNDSVERAVTPIHLVAKPKEGKSILWESKALEIRNNAASLVFDAPHNGISRVILQAYYQLPYTNPLKTVGNFEALFKEHDPYTFYRLVTLDITGLQQNDDTIELFVDKNNPRCIHVLTPRVYRNVFNKALDPQHVPCSFMRIEEYLTGCGQQLACAVPKPMGVGGGKTKKKSDKKVNYKGKTYAVYVGPRGGEYIMLKNKFVLLSRL